MKNELFIQHKREGNRGINILPTITLWQAITELLDF